MAERAEHRPEGWLERAYGELTPAGLPLNYSSPGLEAFAMVKAGAGSLYSFTVYNNGGAGTFVLLMDATGPPANGLPAAATFGVGATTHVSQGYSWLGRAFHAGIILAHSTTPDVLTLTAKNCIFDAQYL